MADGRRGHAFDTAIATAVFAAAAVWGGLNSLPANPYDDPPPPKTEAERRESQQEAKDILRVGLGQMVGKRGR